MQEQDLADFQADLLEILSTQDNSEIILPQLSSQPLDEGLTSYISTFDPNMVDLAATLIKKWGRKIHHHFTNQSF